MGSQQGGNEHEPWFVARKDLENNTLWVVQGRQHPWLLTPDLRAQDLSWVAERAPNAIQISAKTRYRQDAAACKLDLGSNSFVLRFAQSQWAVTPGQSAVLYDDDVCLGGGVIQAKSVNIRA